MPSKTQEIQQLKQQNQRQRAVINELKELLYDATLTLEIQRLLMEKQDVDPQETEL